MKALRLLPLLGFLAFAATAGAAPEAAPVPLPALDALKEKGRLLLSDGGTWYLLDLNGGFHSGPWGLCGETIDGTWIGGKDGRFLIHGAWGWMNGVSQIDDLRVLSLEIGSGAFHPWRPSDLSLGGGPYGERPPPSDLFDGTIRRGTPVKDSQALPWVR